MVIVLLGGAILMAVRRGEHGRGAVLGMAGCIVLFLGVVCNGILVFATPSLVSSMGVSGIQPLFLVVNLVILIFQVVGTVLLISGVVARRNPAAPAQQGQWQPEWQPQSPYQQQPPQQPAPQQQQQPGWQSPPQPPFGGGQG
ncbi:hypothetical protein ACFPZ3_68675 [Nonomuraea insulae]|uniref:Uncharacterized protein n=2 Tax=Nonomuraea insulae TaxID=1616787 RepID=A0ABW1DE78_9ACTN